MATPQDDARAGLDALHRGETTAARDLLLRALEGGEGQALGGRHVAPRLPLQLARVGHAIVPLKYEAKGLVGAPAAAAVMARAAGVSTGAGAKGRVCVHGPPQV